jgi:6-phosphogluconolactonase
MAAAERLIARIDRTSGPAAICLTGGSTPKRLYRLLASTYRSRIPWPQVHWFMGDDRFVPQNDPLSNMGAARRVFLDDCAPSKNIHAIDTGVETPDIAAIAYEQELRIFTKRNDKQPLFDLVLMGAGPDGHTASLFPNSSAVDEKEKWVVGVAKANVEPFVPRVTLTLPTLGSTHEMLFMASGGDKRDILNRIFNDDRLPAARAHAMHGETVWLIDEAAAPQNLHR